MPLSPFRRFRHSLARDSDNPSTFHLSNSSESVPLLAKTVCRISGNRTCNVAAILPIASKRCFDLHRRSVHRTVECRYQLLRTFAFHKGCISCMVCLSLSFVPPTVSCKCSMGTVVDDLVSPLVRDARLVS